MKKITSVVVMLLLLPIAFAAQTRVDGDIALNWDNAYNRPQQFSGEVTGDLVGDISLTSNTDYDTSSTHVGVTWSDDVLLELDEDVDCEGFYGGSNVNDGRNVGTFTLSCDDESFIQGMMYGVNDAYGNMNLHYSGLRITALDGEQGIQGEKGDKGDTGETGLQGIQGEQGLQGDKGDVGPKGDTGECTCDMTEINNIIDGSKAYSLFDGFWLWYYSPQECELDEKDKCVGDEIYYCDNYEWVSGGTCPYGCADGKCNPPPKDNCLTKPSDYYCMNSYYSVEKDYNGCQSGHGTSTSCDIGYCSYVKKYTICSKGCDTVTGKCN